MSSCGNGGVMLLEVVTAMADFPRFKGLPRLRGPSSIENKIVLLGRIVNILYDGMG